MTLQTIITADPSQPVEVQAWLNANPDVNIQKMFAQGNIFYILY